MWARSSVCRFVGHVGTVICLQVCMFACITFHSFSRYSSTAAGDTPAAVLGQKVLLSRSAFRIQRVHCTVANCVARQSHSSGVDETLQVAFSLV